ncbi:MAG: class I SAM-dependent methyltransferase [Candidatus Hodarchaeota archaeon]
MLLELQETPDVFGRILKAQLDSTEPIYHGLERDDGYIDCPTAQKYFTTVEEWPAHEREILQHAESPILDIGCGAGRHALYLQEQGMDVTGFDISEGAISVCRQRGLKKTVHGSATNLPSFQQSFNTFLLLFNNFGICGTPTDTVKMLNRIHQLGSRQAKILLSFADPSGTKKPYHLALHQRNRAEGLPIGQIRLRWRYLAYASSWFPLWLPTFQEFFDTIEKAQWTISKDLNNDGYHHVVLIKQER